MIIYLERHRTKWLWALVVSTAILLFWNQIVAASYGIGDFISEKLIDNSGATSSQLLITRDGITNSDMDLTMGVLLTTNPATNVTSTQATLHGTVTDMKNFPQANVYFEWGYTAAYGNTTPIQTVVGVGAYEAAITGLVGGQTVHFRGVSEADGTYYGADQSFGVAPTGAIAAHQLLWLIIPLIILVAMVILAIKFKSPTFVIIGIVGYILSWVLAKALLGIGLPWSW